MPRKSKKGSNGGNQRKGVAFRTMKPYNGGIPTRKAARGVFEKAISGKVGNENQNYLAVCDNKNCPYLSKGQTKRAKDMPKDQFEVSFIFF